MPSGESFVRQLLYAKGYCREVLGLDGTRIPAFWLPFAYGHLYGPPGDLGRFTDFMKKRYDALAPFARGRDRVGLAGVDVSEPELHVAALTEQFNRQTN